MELGWQEIIKLAKVNIIIKMPAVLIQNILSNLLAPIQLGMSPAESVRLQLQGSKDLTQYMNWHKEAELLKDAEASGNTRELDTSRIEMLEARMKDSAAAPLMDAGLFQAIVEDANIEDMETSGKITKKVDKTLDNAPTFVKTGLNWLFLTERTNFFKGMTKFTQYSDFVGRYALYHGTNSKLKRKLQAVKQGDLKAGVHSGMKMTKATTPEDIHEHVLQLVTDVFINYSVPNSKVLEYANKMGLVMFTKYIQRIQRVLKAGAINHPANFALALAGQDMFYDVSDIGEQSYITKDMSYMIKNPIDNLMTAITPQSATLIGDTYDFFTK